MMTGMGPLPVHGSHLWEVVVYDGNSNSVYDTGEPLITGTAPAVGTTLKDDPKIKYVDSNSNNIWTTGFIGIWSDTYKSYNITDLFLTVGQFTVKVNVTETPTINAYEFFLDYRTSYIIPTKVIIKEGTFFGDSCVLCLNETSTPGVVRVSIGVTGANAKAGSGTLAFITFQVVGIGATALNLRDDKFLLGGNLIDHTTQDGLFSNTLAKPPLAQFTHSPTTPVQGDTVTFDASGSTDTDGRIVSYFWRWGDDTGTSPTPNLVITHVFRDRNGNPTYGTFTVSLRVTDDTGLTDSTSAQITVTRLPFHDVLIGSLTSNFLTANPGQIVTLSVSVTNGGTYVETTQLRVYVGSTLLDTREGISLNPGQSADFEIKWDTTGFAPSVYRITANVTAVPNETNIANNSDDSTFVSIVSAGTGLSASLIVGSSVGATAIMALAFFLLRRRKPKAE